MAHRVLTSLRRTRGLLMRTVAHPSQPHKRLLQDLDTLSGFPCSLRKFKARSFCNASTGENNGNQAEQSSENSITSPEDKISDNLSSENEGEPAPIETPEFEASIKVSAPVLGLVVGRRGATINNIQNATKARIKIPPGREVRSGVSLVVKGSTQESVDAAVTRIKNILRRAEKNPSLEYSHFISVPLASHQDLVERVKDFRKSVLADERESNNYVSWFPEAANKQEPNVVVPETIKKVHKIKGSHILDPDLEGLFSDDESSDEEEEHSMETTTTRRSRIRRSFFVKPQTFHLTVLMLKLYTEQSVHSAAEVLQGLKPKVLEALNGHEPKVHLKGIECLRGNPAEARVVSMRVHEINAENPIHRACYVIRDAFLDAGLVAAKDLSQDIQLHAALMNANYAPRLNTRLFDARKILMKHKYDDWGEYTINEIHLSQRFFYDPSGYYRCCGSLELPSPVSEKMEVKDVASQI